LRVDGVIGANLLDDVRVVAPFVELDLTGALSIHPDTLKAVIAPPFILCCRRMAFEPPVEAPPSISHIPHSPSARSTITALPPIAHAASTTAFLPRFPTDEPDIVFGASDLLLRKPGYMVKSHDPNCDPKVPEPRVSDEVEANIWDGSQS
jgi:hypothetical protein